MLILHNARVYTMNPEQPVVNALAIQGGRIFAAGDNADILALTRPEDKVVDMAGKTIWPGLTDAHLHLEYYAGFLQSVDSETDTIDECLQRVETSARSLPEGAWVRGHGWNQNVWEGGFGTAAQLDAVAHGHPVFLTAKSGHAAWANSAALKMAGITANTPDPTGGVIMRGPNGQPTGILLETAMEAVEVILPEPSDYETSLIIEEAQNHLWKVGITCVHDFDRRRSFEALQILNARGGLKLRVVKSIPMELLAQAAAVGLRTGFGGDYLRIGSVKMFADGALGPRTAAMLQPFEGENSETGILLLDSEQILEHGQVAADTGMSLAIHAIGDRANHEVLDAFEQLRVYEKEKGLPAFRHRIEHTQLLHPDDIDRLAQLGVIASMQPIHATSDMYIAEKFWGARSMGAYAWKSLLNRGTHMAFGSDAPVESPNPFWGLHAAVTRTRPGNIPSADGWYPAERLTLVEALAGFTTGPAYAANWEDEMGQLAPGFFADLIVLKDDPFTLPPQDLHDLLPQATMVGGEWVWEENQH